MSSFAGGAPVFIRAIAEFLPEHRESNEELASQHPEWDVDRLAAKTGIVSRRIVSPGETASDLAFKAAVRLFDSATLSRGDVDYLVYCTQSPDYYLPATACVLQSRLGISTAAGAFDFNQGCSGYVYGLQLARALIAAGDARNVLLLTAETYSRYIHPGDRTVRVLFGDGASATWLSADGPGARIDRFAVGTDGSGAENLIVPAGGARTPKSADSAQARTDTTGCIRSAENLFMNGREVFNFTLQRVPEVIGRLLQDDLTIGEIDWFVFHQANEFMNQHLTRKLGIPAGKAPLRVREIGNTVSSTIPLLLVDAGAGFKEGDRVLLAGFGVGYSWAAALLQWGSVTLAGSAS